MKRWHYDTDGDGTLESASGDGDPQYWFCYDESWRVVAAYRKTDAAPKERFVYHAAGLGGFGDGSYIDAVVLREKDANSAWNAASDTLEQRVYYLQNWRADVVALVNDFGLPLEYVRYSPYGVPTRTPISEYNGDGVFDGFDYDDFVSDYAAASGYVRALDVNLDGSLDAFDYDDFVNDFLTEQAAGRGVLSGDPMDGGVGNRKGYAGYEFEPALAGIDDDSDSPDDPTALYLVRHRVYDAARGTWTRRDPLGYVDFMNVYEYGRSHPIDIVDPHGQFVQLVCCSTCIGLGIWDLANGWSECANKQSWKERIACGVTKLLPGDKLFAIGDCLRKANDRSSSRERREAIVDCLQGTALDIVHIASCICCIGPAIKPFLRSPPAVPMPTPLVPALGTAVSACCGSYEERSEFDSHRGAE